MDDFVFDDEVPRTKFRALCYRASVGWDVLLYDGTVCLWAGRIVGDRWASTIGVMKARDTDQWRRYFSAGVVEKLRTA